jgi:uncharacterized membrane protein
MNWITQNFTTIMAIVGAVIVLARLIVKVTPSNIDNIWLDRVVSVLKTLGLHID